MLYIITVVVNFVALAIAVWLGVYLISHSPRSVVAWLAGLTLWSLSGIFLNVLLALNPPPAPALYPLWLRPLLWFWPADAFQRGWGGWLQGWQTTPAVMIWHHLTVLLRPGRVRGWRLTRILAGYGIAALAIAGQRYTTLVFTSTSGDPLYLTTLVPGPLYPLYLVALLTFTTFSLINLLRSAKASFAPLQAKQLHMMALATGLAFLEGLVAALSYKLGLRLPRVTLSFLLGVAVLLLGYAVARYSALIEGRLVGRDLLYNGLAVLLVAMLYVAVAWTSVMAYHVPIAAIAVVGILAILTHSLVDVGRRGLDILFYRRETRRVRDGLRNLVHQAQSPEILEESISEALQTLCRLVRASYGILLLFKEGRTHQVSAHRWPREPVTLGAPEFYFDDVVLLRPAELHAPLDTAALAIPLYAGEQQGGVLVLGRPENALAYSAEDIEKLLDPTDRIADAIWDAQRESERLARLTQLAQTPPSAWDLQASFPVKAVESAFRNLYDYAYLADGPLAELVRVPGEQAAGGTTHLDRGKQVCQALLAALEKLRPAADMPRAPIPREWFPYLILRYAYCENFPNNQIMSRLYISEGTFNRARRMAIRSVARALLEMNA